MSASVIVIDPRAVSWANWSALVGSGLRAYGLNIPLGLPEKEWQRFAYAITDIPSVAGLDPPRPQAFKTWQMWGLALNQTLLNSGL